MNSLTPREYKVLCEIFRAREKTLRKAMAKMVKQCYPEENIISTKDYIYAWGDIPVGLVAHLDTVHKIPPIEIFRDKKAGVIWSPEGIGADDRAGVYAIFSLLQDGYRPTVIFCTQEEVGGLGAEALIKDIPQPKSPLNFLIELDRRGKEDMVFYECDNPEFEDYIGEFGFIKGWGSYSDIASIAPEWEVAAVNLSIGYQDEHTKVERLYYNHMFDTMNKVRQILEAESQEGHPFKYIPGYSYGGAWYKYGYMDDYYDREPTHGVCDGCNGTFPGKELKYIYDGTAKMSWCLCPTCLKELTRKCKVCGNHYMPWSDKYDDSVCDFCHRKQQKESKHDS